MKMYLCVLGAMIAASSVACADVTLVSRRSEAKASHRDGYGIPPWLEDHWDEIAFTDQFGSWSATLPHGYVHQDDAGESGFGGSFLGTWRGGRPDRDGRTTEEANQRIVFRTDVPQVVALDFSAQCKPCGINFTSSPNVQLTLVNRRTGRQVFELFRDGTRFESHFATVEWSAQSWTAIIPRGEYELWANGDCESWELNAGVSVGIGDVHFSFTFGQEGCATDFNLDGFVDFFDYAAFIQCFEGEACPTDQNADFNDDGFIDFFDFGDFVAAFEAGC